MRHVLLQKSAVLVAAPLRCSCDHLWSPLFLLAPVYMPHVMLIVMYTLHAHHCMICKFLILLIPLISYLYPVVYKQGNLNLSTSSLTRSISSISVSTTSMMTIPTQVTKQHLPSSPWQTPCWSPRWPHMCQRLAWCRVSVTQVALGLR